MKNILIKITSSLIISTLFIGCGYESKNDITTPITDEISEPKPNSEKISSKVSDESQLVKALSEEGSLKILIQDNISTSENLEIKEELSKETKDNEGNLNSSVRELILYSEDDKGNITSTYKITAPKLTIKRANTLIKDGIFEGDIYIDSENCTLYKTKVEGNVYFNNNLAKDTFKLEEGATVTGEIKLK